MKTKKTNDYLDNLKKLVNELNEEKNSLENTISYNVNTILETKNFLAKLSDSKASELRFFTPRNPSIIYKDQVLENTEKVLSLENENRELYKNLNIISKRITTIVEYLEFINIENKLEVKTDEIIVKVNNNNITSFQEMEESSTILNQIIDEEVNDLNNLCLDHSSNINKNKQDNIYIEKNKLESIVRISSISIQEKERERIARDLHDTSLQNLTHMIHKIELATKYMDVDILRAKLELAGIIKNIKDVNQDIRNTIYNLKPMVLNDLGYQELFSRMKENYRLKSEIEIHLEILELEEISDVIKITIFRIVDEAVCNAIKHSHAKNIFIKMTETVDEVIIQIIDDGIGINLENSNCNENKKDVHFGLEIMKERVFLIGGKLKIENIEGTMIQIELPKNGGTEND